MLLSPTLAIERIGASHAEGLLAVVNANRAHLREWLTWVDNMQTVEHFLRFTAGALQRAEAGMEFPGVITENGIVIGRIGLYQIDGFNRHAAIGYWIGKAHEGKGVVTQATQAMIRHGFEALNLNRLEIRCATGNLRSQAIPKRLGFTPEGVIRQCEVLHGGFVDHQVYGLLREEWRE